MDPPCLRSRNSWRIRSNWDSNARPDLLAVGVGCCQRKELLRGISNLCMGWWGNAKFPDVSWYFTCASKNVCWQFSSWFGSECYRASLFLMTFARVPSIFDIWDSPTPLAQKVRSRAKEILLSHPTVFDGWTSRCRGLGFEIYPFHSQWETPVKHTEKKQETQVDDIFQYPWWPPTMRLKMNSGMVNNIAYCNGWSIWSMSWS